jgi:ribosome biogenesis protein BRX1
MDELKMPGNCLKGSRPILSFDSSFTASLHGEGQSHLPLIKELLTHAFATPKTSRKIKPFIDRVVSFSVCDGRIWFRNFQIVEDGIVDDNIALDGLENLEDCGLKLVEIGPRFVLSIHRVFDGAFGGRTLYENPDYVSPNTVRSRRRLIV